MDTLRPPQGAERRVAARKTFRGPVALRLSNGQVLQARGIDLSASGIGVQCPVNVPPRLTFDLEITLMDREKRAHVVHTAAVVAYCVLSGQYDGFHVGMQFKNLPPETAGAVLQYLKG